MSEGEGSPTNGKRLEEVVMKKRIRRDEEWRNSWFLWCVLTFKVGLKTKYQKIKKDLWMIKSHATVFGQKSCRSRHTSGLIRFCLDSDCFIVGLESVGLVWCTRMISTNRLKYSEFSCLAKQSINRSSNWNNSKRIWNELPTNYSPIVTIPLNYRISLEKNIVIIYPVFVNYLFSQKSIFSCIWWEQTPIHLQIPKQCVTRPNDQWKHPHCKQTIWFWNRKEVRY